MALVGLGRPEQARAFCAERAGSLRCLTSPDASAHRAYGLRRGKLSELAGPKVWGPWVRNQVSGLPQGRFGQGDVAQLPGTFVVDPEGIVRYVHRGERSNDTPPNDEVLLAVAAVW